MEEHKSENTNYFLWQFFVLIFITWTALEAPLSYSLNLALKPWQIWLDGLITLIFSIDILVNINRNRQQQNHPEKTGYIGHMDYKKSVWLPMDILACIPFDVIGSIFGALSGFHVFRLLRLLRLIRLFKLFSMMSIVTVIPRPIKILSILFCCIMAIHWITCGWILINPLNEIDLVTMYNKSAYWAVTTLTTIGYGDITPSNNIGRCYTMFIMILGVGVYGIVIANVSRIILAADRHKEENKEKLHDLTLFMKHYNVPPRLQHQAVHFYQTLMRERLFANDDKIISELPQSLKYELQLYMNMKLIKQIPLFAQSTVRCLKLICTKLILSNYSPGNNIIKKGDPGEEVFIIKHGTVEVLDEKGKVIVQLTDGQFFGEKALLQNVTRNANVVAKTYCDIYKLDKESFLEVINDFPELRRNIQSVVTKREAQKEAA